MHDAQRNVKHEYVAQSEVDFLTVLSVLGSRWADREQWLAPASETISRPVEAFARLQAVTPLRKPVPSLGNPLARDCEVCAEGLRNADARLSLRRRWKRGIELYTALWLEAIAFPPRSPGRVIWGEMSWAMQQYTYTLESL